MKIRRFLFPAGVFLSALATGAMILISCGKFHFGPVSVIFALLAAASFFGMLESLFFCLPKDTYRKPEEKRKAFRGKMYALCRHPGVLFHALLYLFLCLLFPEARGIAIAATLVALNVVYMILQDAWTFPREFSDYADYKKEVPFFFPTFRSIRKCALSYRKK